MPGRNSVRACGNALNGEAAIISTDRKERRLHHSYIRLHPGMLIALHRHENLVSGKRFLNWRSAVWLRLIPLWILFRCWMDIVCCGVTIGDAYLLIRLNTQDVRPIVATILIQLNCGCWGIPFKVAHFLAISCRSIFDVHECVGELPILNDRVLCFQVRILLSAHGISFGAGGVPLNETTPLTVPVAPEYFALASEPPFLFVSVSGALLHDEPIAPNDRARAATSQTFVCFFIISSSKLVCLSDSL